MKRPVVCVIDPISPDALAWLAERAHVIGPDDPKIAMWPDEAHAVIVRTSPVTAEAIASARHLKVVAKHGVGVDNIDLAAARLHGIRVTNTPHTNTNATAELAITLMLAAARRLPAAMRRLWAGTPIQDTDLLGRELSGLDVGLVGFGHVAQRVAAILRYGFGCRLRAFSPSTPSARFSAAGVQAMNALDDLAASVDVLSIHLPLKPETRNLVGARVLSRMRRGSILINTARGGIVDETALLEALTHGPLGAAASDVFVHEPPLPDHPLLLLPNFVATPHIGAFTTNAMAAMGMKAAQSALMVVAGETPADGIVV